MLAYVHHLSVPPNPSHIPSSPRHVLTAHIVVAYSAEVQAIPPSIFPDMFAVMPLPVFHDHTAVFRPASPSLLSSSPIRAASPPLAPRDPNALPRRDTKSSPIRGPNFRFASRPSRPVPIVQKREAAQEARRKLFLRNVRQRADDKAWERRGGDQEVCSTLSPWLRDGC